MTTPARQQSQNPVDDPTAIAQELSPTMRKVMKEIDRAGFIVGHRSTLRALARRRLCGHPRHDWAEATPLGRAVSAVLTQPTQMRQQPEQQQQAADSSTRGPINREAILAKPIGSLMESGVKPVSDTEVTLIEQERAADAVMDAWSAEDLVKSYRAALTYAYDPTVKGIDRQAALREANKHILSLDRRRRKATENVVLYNVWFELKDALQAEQYARRDLMHYLVRPDSGGEEIAHAAQRLAETMRRADDLSRLFIDR